MVEIKTLNKNMEEEIKTITTWEVEGETLKKIITPTEIAPKYYLTRY